MNVTEQIITDIHDVFKNDVRTPTYSIAPATVTKYQINVVDEPTSAFPNISLLIEGDEQRVVEGANDGNDRFEWFLQIMGHVKCDTEAEISDELAQVEALIKEVVYNQPTLTNVLQWKYLEIVDRGQGRSKDRFFGWVTARTRLIYYVTSGAY